MALKEGRRHALYEEQRVLDQSSARWQELQDLMQALSAELSTPANIEALGTLVAN